MKIDITSEAERTDKGSDWRAQVGIGQSAPRSVDLERAREPGRGREAETPEQIPPLGWKDILWRVLRFHLGPIGSCRLLGAWHFLLFSAVFPGIAAIVSLYGLCRRRKHDQQTLDPSSPGSYLGVFFS